MGCCATYVQAPPRKRTPRYHGCAGQAGQAGRQAGDAIAEPHQAVELTCYRMQCYLSTPYKE